MMKIKMILVFTFSLTSLFAQKKSCETPKEDLMDLNSIVSTKCSIKSSKNKKDKKTRQIRVRVSTSRKRYLKARANTHSSGVNQKRNSANSLNNLNIAGVSSGADKSLIAKNSLISITNTLSAEEVRKAHRFYHVDKIPTFTKCSKYKGNKRMDCFNEQMMNHINENFRYPSAAVRDQIEGEVWVRFVIDSEGKVTNIKTMGPDGAEILDNEAMRVVSSLPFFEPGEFKGEKVAVKYGFPINFSLEQ